MQRDVMQALSVQIAVTRLSFSVQGKILVSALNRNVMVLLTAMILQMKQTAVSHFTEYYTLP